jgi:hypothetical protein
MVISHHKTIGRENFGRLNAAQAARALNVFVTWSKSARALRPRLRRQQMQAGARAASRQS